MSNSSKKALTIMRREENPDDFLTAINSFNISSDQFTLNAQYRAEFADDYLRDCSFCVMKNGDVQLIVFCHHSGEVLDFNSAAIHFLGHNDNKKVIRAAFDELERIACATGAEQIKIADYNSAQRLSVLGAEAFQRDGVPTCRFDAVIDLQQSETEIKRDLRGSYKSLINQIRRDMTFVYLSKDNADKELFEKFREFHLKVAGRATRSLESWDAQFEMVAAGCAEVVLGYIEPHGLVSSALFTDFGKTTSYAVAVYDRELFGQRSLAHANVYEGILRAKDRGQTSFVLGHIPPRGTASDKEYSIGVFKKGFCDQPLSSLEWCIPVTESQMDSDH